MQCCAANRLLNQYVQAEFTDKHPTVRFDTWKEKRFLLIIPAYEKARMIRKRISNHSDF